VSILEKARSLVIRLHTSRKLKKRARALLKQYERDPELQEQLVNRVLLRMRELGPPEVFFPEGVEYLEGIRRRKKGGPSHKEEKAENPGHGKQKSAVI